MKNNNALPSVLTMDVDIEMDTAVPSSSFWTEPVPLNRKITNDEGQIIKSIQERIRSRVTSSRNNGKKIDDITLLHIAVTGSRGKGMASTNSDYDTKVLVLHSRKDYMLQKNTETWSFDLKRKPNTNKSDNGGTGRGNGSGNNDNDDVDGIDLEGTVIDMLRFIKYIQGNGMDAYEFFSGIPIYTTRIVQELKCMYRKHYVGRSLLSQYRGMLHQFKKKNIDVLLTASKKNYQQKKEQEKEKEEQQQQKTDDIDESNVVEETVVVPNKKAFEIVYLAAKVLYMYSNPTIPPPFDARELLEKYCHTVIVGNGNNQKPKEEGNEEEEEDHWMYNLLQARMDDKNANFVVTDEFLQLANTALDVGHEKGNNNKKKNKREKNIQSSNGDDDDDDDDDDDNDSQTKLEDLFLQVIDEK